jgi:hypothetical protein
VADSGFVCYKAVIVNSTRADRATSRGSWGENMMTSRRAAICLIAMGISLLTFAGGA